MDYTNFPNSLDMCGGDDSEWKERQKNNCVKYINAR